jgi:hypothetical protein
MESLPLIESTERRAPERSWRLAVRLPAGVVPLVPALLAAAVLSATGALLWAPRIAASRVDIGVDVAADGGTEKPAPGPPRVYRGSGPERIFVGELKPISPRFAPEGQHRFRGRIPRAAVNDLVIEPDGEGASRVSRVFVATTIPHVFYSPRQWPEHYGWQGDPEVWRGLPQGKGGRLALPEISRLEAGGRAATAALGVVFFAALVLSVLLVRGAFGTARRAWQRPLPSASLRPFSPEVFASFLLPMLAVWSLYLTGFFPGLSSPDAASLWKQAHGEMALSNAHPVLNALLISVLIRAWDSPAVVASSQILFMVVVAAHAYTLLWRARVPVWALAVAFLLTVLSPRNGFMSVVLWKDTPYSVCCLLLAALLARAMLDERWRERWWSWAGLAGVLALIALFRHNGLLVTVGVAALLPVVFRRRSGGALVAAAGALLIFGAAQVAFANGYGVDMNDRYFSRLNTVRLFALLLHRDAPLREKEYRLIEGAFAVDKLKRSYDWWDMDRAGGGKTLKWRNVNLPHLGRNQQRSDRVTASLARRYPSHVIRYLARSSGLLYKIFPDRKFRTMSLKRARNGGSVRRARPIGAFLTSIYRRTLKKDLSWLFWHTGWHLYLSLAALGVVVYRTREPRWAIVFLPFYLNTLSLTLSAAAPHARYQFSLALATGFLCCLAFIPGSRAPITADGISARFNGGRQPTKTAA